MSIHVNGIDLQGLYDMVAFNEARLSRIEKYMDYIRKNNECLNLPDVFELEIMTKKAYEEVKKKYPNTNLKFESKLPGRN